MMRRYEDGRHQERTTICVSVTDLRRPRRDRFEGPVKRAIERGRNRALVAGALFALGFFAVTARLVDVAMFPAAGEPRLSEAMAKSGSELRVARGRADIVDRNGILLATNLASPSLYADPSQIIDPAAAAKKLATVLHDLDVPATTALLDTDRRFVWLRRTLTPRQQVAVNRLGIPGIHFLHGERRVYPHGRLASHVLGFTDVDDQGLAGVERYFDQKLRAVDKSGKPLQLSIDIRLQHVLHQELATAVEEQKALGGSGLIMDVTNGEIMAMVSLPDFDPNRTASASALARFNRNTLGVYEMGSTFKIFTVAMALESGMARLEDQYDVGRPLRVARYTINDLHTSSRTLSVAEIFTKSSNIGAAQLALKVGTPTLRSFLGRFGMFEKPSLELSEIGAPLRPEPWREINTMTIAFGHGLAISPTQLAAGVAAVTNGGMLYHPTLVKRAVDKPIAGKRVLSVDTSFKMRELMRRVVLEGTGRKAAVPGYQIGGKTGTAEKTSGNGYSKRRLLSSFVGVFPASAPRYLVLVLIDEPKGVGGNARQATGGWVAAPVVGRVVARAGMMLGVPPQSPQREIGPTSQPIINVSAGGRRIVAE